MRVVFIGCVQSSWLFLESLIEIGANIAGVVTKEESSFNADFRDLAPLCEINNIPYIYTKNGNDNDTFSFIERCSPDLVFCVGWSYLIEERIIKLSKMGMIGYHPAMLPYNRGRHPIVWALALGLEKTASTFFMVEEKADTGDIVSQNIVEIKYEDTAESLMGKLLDVGSNQIKELYRQFLDGSVTFVKQNTEEGNFWRKRRKNDGQIDWRMSSRSIYNLVRALTRPYVGAHFIRDDKEVKVWKVEEVFSDKYNNIEPGKVIEVSGTCALVKTGDNLIKLVDFDNIDLKQGEYL